MSNKKISAIGNGRQDRGILDQLRDVDPNHNEELDTQQMLMDGFFRKLGGALPPEDDVPSSESTQDFHFMGPNDAIRLMRAKKLQATAGGDAAAGDAAATSALQEQDKKISSLLSKIKEDAIYLFQGSDESVQRIVHRMIMGLESVQANLGYTVTPFDKARYLSGLDISEADMLTNANAVMANTLSKYRAHVINSIETVMAGGKPAIRMLVLGECDGKGFVLKASVVAKSDFNGNEAVDYLPEAGEVTVKAFHAGRWMDVTDKFIVEGRPIPIDLERPADDLKHSVFVGEKIATSAKDIVISKLNLNNNDVRFGKCQAFCRNADDAARIRELIRVKGTK